MITVTCPACGKPMVVRVNRSTDEEFLGCSEWPKCKETRPMPEDVKMRLAGAPTLPGF